MSEGPVRCQGAPRDLGLDQGRALRVRVRAAVAAEEGTRLDRLRRRVLPEPQDRRVARDTRRYFPHMAERLAGLAAGARVSEPALFRLLARELGPPPRGAVLGLGPEQTGGLACIVQSLPAALAGGLFLRSSEPAGDYRSLEVAWPAGVPALAGANEEGLAVALAGAPASAASLERCAAPAALLVQDCLQRFDAVDKAVDWCLRRPAAGRACLVLADRQGDVAAVHLDGARRRVDRGEAGRVLGSARERERERLAKACAGAGRLDGAGAARLLAEGAGRVALEIESGKSGDAVCAFALWAAGKPHRLGDGFRRRP